MMPANTHIRMQPFKRVLRQQDGNVIIEFAIIAPVLLLIVFGIVELSLIMYTQSVMEGATTISARLGKTGYTEDGISREQTILDALNAHATGFVDVSRFTIESKSYGQFDEIGDAEPYVDTNGNGAYDGAEAYTDQNGNGAYDSGEPYVDSDGNGAHGTGETYTDVNGNGSWDEDMGEAGYGDANDIVVYTVNYPWSIMTPMMSAIMGDNGVITLTASAVVKNEPY